MNLAEIQTCFAQSLLTAGSPPPPGVFAERNSMVAGRFMIYRSNVVSSLISSLRDIFPLIEKLTGEDFAKNIFGSFIFSHPPRVACLIAYGGELPSFIGNFEPAASLPYLSDIARLEWALHESYYAPDDSPLRPEDLAGLMTGDLGALRLPLRSSIRLIESFWPLLEIRNFCLRDDSGDERLDLDQGGCRFMTLRRGLNAEIVPLSSCECFFLDCLRKGMTLGDSLGRVMSSEGAFDFAGFLDKFIRLETFSLPGANY